MADNKHEEETIVDIQEQYSKAESFIEENKNALTGILVAVAVAIGGYFGYNTLYLAPLEEEAQEQIWKAQQYFEQDSFNLAINGDGNYYGFETIVETYGSTKTGNLAHYYLGISYLKIGEYGLAVDNLNAFSSDDLILSSVAKGAAGDALMELGETDNAISYYEKAALSSPNDFSTPIYLMKAAKAHETLGDFKKALNKYEKIKKDFPKSQEARTIDKYIARVQTSINNA